MSEETHPPLKGRPVIFGEVLFDAFPDGREVLGGAPFNVARHLHAFGCEPLFISRIGEDERGEQVLRAMREWNMDLSGLQRDPELPTGVVRIAMQGTSHSFDILPNQSYDHINAQQALDVMHKNDAALLYFGSLIERTATSRETLQQLRKRGLPQFVDINLRAPWWQRERVEQLLHGVKWLKLNDEELAALGYEGEIGPAAVTLREEYGFELLIVTCGAEGALVADRRGVERGAPVPVEQLVDTVGAGDAFSAVTLLGLMRGWSMGVTLERALGFAAHLCEVRGAVLPKRDYYLQQLQRWGEDSD